MSGQDVWLIISPVIVVSLQHTTHCEISFTTVVHYFKLKCSLRLRKGEQPSGQVDSNVFPRAPKINGRNIIWLQNEQLGPLKLVNHSLWSRSTGSCNSAVRTRYNCDDHYPIAIPWSLVARPRWNMHLWQWSFGTVLPPLSGTWHHKEY